MARRSQYYCGGALNDGGGQALRSASWQPLVSTCVQLVNTSVFSVSFAPADPQQQVKINAQKNHNKV